MNLNVKPMSDSECNNIYYMIMKIEEKSLSKKEIMKKRPSQNEAKLK